MWLTRYIKKPCLKVFLCALFRYHLNRMSGISGTFLCLEDFDF